MPALSPSVHALHCCAWRTVSLDAASIAALEARVRELHSRAAIVSSCQRLEAYSLHACECDAPEKWIGKDALSRLAEVAAGLHSVVLGEAQILGQVRRAFIEGPSELGAIAAVAIAAARELRRQTHFDSHAGHLLDRSLALAGIEPRGRLLVLGSGAMGRLVAGRAVDLGFAEVLVAGRSRPASETECWSFVPLGAIGALDRVDVVAGCLGSGAGETPFEALPPVMRLAIDLGTPRNFPPSGPVRVITIADLLADEASRPHAARRREELARSLSRILQRRLGQLERSALASVVAMRTNVERVRQQELARMRRLHPEVSPETLDVLTRSLVNQIFHAPSQRLKELGDARLSQDLATLFG